jgi:hypothetical protein
VISDDELLAATTRDLRVIYAYVIRQPLPESYRLNVKKGWRYIRASPQGFRRQHKWTRSNLGSELTDTKLQPA